MATDKQEYTFDHKGSTTGAVTGRTRRYLPGDPIEAPEGEFDHLPEGTYETRPLAPKSEPEAEPGGGPIYHVRKGEEDWRVEKDDADQASSTHDTKKEAVAAGEALAQKNGPATLVIHKTDGDVQTRRELEPAEE